MKTSSLAAALLAVAPTAATGWTWAAAHGKSINFTSVSGYFVQDDAATNPSGFDYASVNFGLINRTYPTDKRFDPNGEKTQWQRFEAFVKFLNSACSKRRGVQYKLLFIGRHGEGWHNAAESFYGTPAWNCYWAEQEGNGTAVWADPLLTPAGEVEAYKANAYFKDRYETQKLPFFESYYTSPLSRCTITANLTFGDISLPADRPFAPIVKEGFREGMTVHTCNRRSSKTYISKMFPFYQFEEGFTEEDELWRADEAETDAAFAVRAKEVLDDVFTTDPKTWISITAHSGAATRLLAALNHRPFRLATGQIIPVLVKAEAVERQPTPPFDAHEPYSTCDAPPITSVAGQGCVCATSTTSALPSATGEPDECPTE
ncbi:phosphoglycerate mutase [Parathielavia appendiculata]|uniref:Phosphoglycerate mutase n=1 Tax=Parathielavia appendiculata TaxID=2587402 RepID=A0AAN6TX40_9PEZI|nr:phosphoglycerate mutase [Parathielavia appendiculata]